MLDASCEDDVPVAEHDDTVDVVVPQDEAPVEQDDEEMRYLKEDVTSAEQRLATVRAEAEQARAALNEMTAQHSVRIEARAAEHANALKYLSAFLKLGSLSTRRRVLYLRNFGAMCLAISPLVPTLATAIVDSGLSIAVVAGVWRVRRMSWSDEPDTAEKKYKDKHEAFVKSFANGATLTDYVKRKYTPTWRIPSSEDRFSGLAQMFETGILHRHYLREERGLGRRRHRTPLFVDSETMLELSHVLAVAAETRVVPLSTASDVLARRLTRFNLPSVQAALRDLDKTWHGSGDALVCEFLELVSARGAGTRSDMTTRIIRL